MQQMVRDSWLHCLGKCLWKHCTLSACPSLEFQKLFPGKSVQPISLSLDVLGLVNSEPNISIQRLTELIIWLRHSPSHYLLPGLPVGDKRIRHKFVYYISLFNNHLSVCRLFTSQLRNVIAYMKC